MKKIIFIMLLAFSLNGFAQAQKKGSVEFGFNIGYNRANATIRNQGSTDPISGLNLGLSSDYYFSNRWSIKGKLIYDPKGWENAYIQQYNPNNGFSSITITNFKLNYVTIPVMANWHFGKKRNWYLNFGPYVGFLVSAKDTKLGFDLKDTFNSTDFGLALGIGVKIPVSDKMRLTIEYDEQDGFIGIYKISPGGSIVNSRGGINLGLNIIMK